MLRTVVKSLLPEAVVASVRRFRASGPIITPLIERYCQGRGIEVGAGKYPCSPSRNTIYIDKHTLNADGTPNPDIVADADRLPCSDESVDFVVSSHVLEHMPNTIATLNEWKRVIKRGGVLFLILPHGDRTFDRLREKTTLEHHIADFEAGVSSPDRSHIEEIERGWRPLTTPETEAEYRERWKGDPWDWDHRFANDVVHYHVWTQDEIIRLLQYLGMKIVYANETANERDDSFIVVARKA